MNRIFKVVWSKAKRTYVVASELAKGVTKGASASSHSMRKVAAVLAAAALLGGAGGVTGYAEVTQAQLDAVRATANSNSQLIADNESAINALTGRVTTLENNSGSGAVDGLTERITTDENNAKVSEGYTQKYTDSGEGIKNSNTVGKNLEALDAKIDGTRDTIWNAHTTDVKNLQGNIDKEHLERVGDSQRLQTGINEAKEADKATRTALTNETKTRETQNKQRADEIAYNRNLINKVNDNFKTSNELRYKETRENKAAIEQINAGSAVSADYAQKYKDSGDGIKSTNTVGQNLEALDAKIDGTRDTIWNAHTTDVKNLQGNIDKEFNQRVVADENLQRNLNTETEERKLDVGHLQTNINQNTASIATTRTELSNEKTLRETADTNLQTNINKNTELINKVNENFTTSNGLRYKETRENKAAIEQINAGSAVSADYAQKYKDSGDGIKSTNTVSQNLEALDAKIDGTRDTIWNAHTTDVKNLQGNIDKEHLERVGDSQRLQTGINEAKNADAATRTALTNETKRAETAEGNLQTNINKNTNLINKVNDNFKTSNALRYKETRENKAAIEQIQKDSEDVKQAAETFNNVKDDVINAADTVKSYDGRLGTMETLGSNLQKAQTLKEDGTYVHEKNTIATNVAAVDTALASEVQASLKRDADGQLVQTTTINEDGTNKNEAVTKLVLNKDANNQVTIDEDGITVGLHSTRMDAEGFTAGGHDYEAAGAAIMADGRIKGGNGAFTVDENGRINGQGGLDVTQSAVNDDGTTKSTTRIQQNEEDVRVDATGDIDSIAANVRNTASNSIRDVVSNAQGKNATTATVLGTKQEVVNLGTGANASYETRADEQKAALVDGTKNTTITTVAGQTSAQYVDGENNVTNTKVTAEENSSSVRNGGKSSIVTQKANSLAGNVTEGDKTNAFAESTTLSQQQIKDGEDKLHITAKTAAQGLDQIKSGKNVITTLKNADAGAVVNQITDGTTTANITTTAAQTTFTNGGSYKVTADSLYDNTTADGNFVKKANSVGQNLGELDTQLNTVKGQVETNTTDISGLKAKTAAITRTDNYGTGAFTTSINEGPEDQSKFGYVTVHQDETTIGQAVAGTDEAPSIGSVTIYTGGRVETEATDSIRDEVTTGTNADGSVDAVSVETTKDGTTFGVSHADNEFDDPVVVSTTIKGDAISTGTVKATKGVTDGTTKDSTAVKASNTVGQNLNALDTRITNVKDYIQKDMGDNFVTKEGFKRDTSVGEGSDIISDENTIGKNVQLVDAALHKEIGARIGADAAQDKVFVEGDNGALKLSDQAELVAQTAVLNADGTKSYSQAAVPKVKVTGTVEATGGFNDGTTTDSTAVKAANTVGQNLNALDTRITNVKDYIQKDMGDNFVTKEGFKRDTSVGEGSDIISDENTIGKNVQLVDAALHKEIGARIGADAAQDKIIVDGDNGALKLNDANEVVKQTAVLNADGTKSYKTETATAVTIGRDDAKADFTVNGTATVKGTAAADGFKDTTTEDGDASRNEVVKKDSTVGQNLNALDSRISNVKDYVLDQSLSKEDFKRETSVGEGSDIISNDNTIGRNVQLVDAALHKEIGARIGADAAQDKVFVEGDNGALKLNDADELVKQTAVLNADGTKSYTSAAASRVVVKGGVEADTVKASKGLYDETTIDHNNIVEAGKSVGTNLVNLSDAITKESAVRENQDKALSDRITANTESIGGMKADIQTNKDAIAKNAGDIQTNKDAIAKNAGDIQTNKDAIAKNAGDIQTNKDAIAKNAGDIQTNKDAIAKNAGDIQTNKDAIAKNAGDIQTNKDAIAKNAGDIQTNKDAIAKNAGDIQTNKDAIAKNAGDIQTNKDAIAKNAGDIQTNKDAIAKNAGDIQANKDAIAKNAEDIGGIKTSMSGAQSDISSIKTKLGETQKGTYVAADKSVGENLNALDNQVATNADDIANNKTSISNIQDSIKTEDGNYVKAANKVGENFKALDSQVKTNTDGIAANKAAIATNAGNIGALQTAVGSTADGYFVSKDQSVGDNLGTLDNALANEVVTRSDQVSRLNARINKTNKEVDQVGAMSMAIAGLHPLSYDEGDAKFQLAAAVGTYDGTQAAAIGGFYHFNRDSMLSFGMTTDLSNTDKFGANMGYTRRIGQGGHRAAAVSEGQVSDILQDIQALKEKQASLEQENKELKEKLEALQKK